MSGLEQERYRDRLKSAVAVALCHALLGYAFLTGLAFEAVRPAADVLKIFEIHDGPVVPAISLPERRDERREGAASPPNVKSVASPVVAPSPAVNLHVPPPVVAAPVPGQGAESSAGAAPLEGPGTGSGGQGIGTGSGSGGNGNGAGGIARRARLLEGELSNADYPRRVKRAGIGGRVQVRIDVGANGRVSACTVTGSSGNAELDETSCRLIRQRYRYRPAEDADARPVPDTVYEAHVWWTRRQGGLPLVPPEPGPTR